jgi:hypothetical protein
MPLEIMPADSVVFWMQVVASCAEETVAKVDARIRTKIVFI